MTISHFLKKAVNSRLDELRRDCAIKRESLRHALGRSWSGADPADQSAWAVAWKREQEQAQRERTIEVAAAEESLRKFIAEHRHLMGDRWPGTDHGRQCWSQYIGCLGGNPIAFHYCTLEEGHEGPCQDDDGEWPNREITGPAQEVSND